MQKKPYEAKSGHVVVQAIRSFFAKLRQNPDVYPIRYYKKNRKYRGQMNSHAVK